MRKIIVFFTCLICPALSFAGGDAVTGNVTDVSAKDGKTIIHFMQPSNARTELISGCKEIEVTVHYARVPWFSWMPFVATSHPSKKETEEAIEYLKKAKLNNQQINFGYMGYGLVPTGDKCSFKSKGLRIFRDQGTISVFSFHDQT